MKYFLNDLLVFAHKEPRKWNSTSVPETIPLKPFTISILDKKIVFTIKVYAPTFRCGQNSLEGSRDFFFLITLEKCI